MNTSTVRTARARTADARLHEARELGRDNQLYVALWTLGGRKVRVTIRVNTYAFQSSARAEVFDVERCQWNDLVSLLPSEIRQKYSHAMPPSVDFTVDEAELLRLARLVLA